MGPAALRFCVADQGIIVKHPAAAGPRRLFEHLVGVLPVVALEPHLLAKLGNNPPVGLGVAGRIVELGVEAQPPLAVATGEVVFTPSGGGKHEVGQFVRDGGLQVDVLGYDGHPAAVGTGNQGSRRLVHVRRGDLVLVPAGHPQERVIKLLRRGHSVDPSCADDPSETHLSGLHPPVQVYLLPPPSRQPVRGLVDGIRSGAHPAALVAAQPGNHPARAVSGPAQQGKGGEGGGVAVVVGPVVALFQGEGGLGTLSVHGFGHQLGGLDDLVCRDARYFGGPVQFGVGLLEQPILVSLEVGPQLAPSGAPLPRSVAGTAPHAGIDLPCVGDPLLNEFAVFPAVFQYHPGQGKLENGVAARYKLQQQAAVLFGPSNAGGLAREHKDQFLASRHHPLGEDYGLAFERVGAGEKDDVGSSPVLVGGAERVDARVVQTGGVCARSGLVVGRVGGGADGAEGQLGNGVGVLEILVGVGLHRPRGFTVVVQDMTRDPRHDFEGRVPGYGGELVVHPQKRRLEPVGGGTVGVVDL